MKCSDCGGEIVGFCLNADKVGNFGLKGSMPDHITIYRCAKCGLVRIYVDKQDVSKEDNEAQKRKENRKA